MFAYKSSDSFCDSLINVPFFVSDLMLAYLCLTLQAVFLDVLIQKDIFVDNKCFASHSPQKSKYRGI